MTIIKNIFDNHTIERIWLLARIEFKLRYYENKLGLIWALLKPLFQMGVYFVAFKVIMSIEIENYALYLFCGILVFGFFGEATTGMLNILKTKKYLYEYSNMSKLEIYFSSLLSISIGFFFNMFVFILAVIFSGIPISFSILYFPILFIILFIFSFGTSMILSCFTIFLKDIKQIWPLIMIALFWLSPIFFAYDNIKAKLPFIEYLNPLAGIIINFRNILMYAASPDWILVGLNLLQSILVFGLGYITLLKLGGKASEKL